MLLCVQEERIAYLFLFHGCLMFQTRFLEELFANLQAGFAVVYLALDGRSLLVALVNLATPVFQVSVSVCYHWSGSSAGSPSAWSPGAGRTSGRARRRGLGPPALLRNPRRWAQVAPLSRLLRHIIRSAARARNAMDLLHVVLGNRPMRGCRSRWAQPQPRRPAGDA